MRNYTHYHHIPFYPRIIKPDLIGSRRKFRSKSSIFQFPDSLDTGNFEQIDRLPPRDLYYYY